MTKRKIFGIGLNKTGTSTLGAALTQLGYHHVTHRGDMLAAYAAGDIDRVIAETRKFDSFEDWPWPLMYREFYAEYGDDARYVLTVRSSPEAWLTSLKKHSLVTNPDRPMRTTAYGYKYPHGYEAEHIAIYEKHNQDVRDFFAARPSAPFIELCWESGHGWKELCGFLGHFPPREPFPHIRPRESGTPAHIIEQNRANIAAQLRAIDGGRGVPSSARA